MKDDPMLIGWQTGEGVDRIGASQRDVTDVPFGFPLKVSRVKPGRRAVAFPSVRGDPLGFVQSRPALWERSINDPGANIGIDLSRRLGTDEMALPPDRQELTGILRNEAGIQSPTVGRLWMCGRCW